MQTNFNAIFRIEQTRSPDLYKKIDSCHSEAELYATLQENSEDLRFILEHIPTPDASNRKLINNVVSLATEEMRTNWPLETQVLLKKVEKTLLTQKLNAELSKAIQLHFSNFASSPIPNSRALAYKLRETTINLAFEQSKLRPIKETLEVADRLISQIAETEQIRVPIPPKEFLSDLTERAFKKARLDMEAPGPASKMESIEEFKDLIKLLLNDFKAENLPELPENIIRQLLENLEKIKVQLATIAPPKSLSCEKLGQDFRTISELTKFLSSNLKETPELISKIGEVAQVLGDRFIKAYDSYHSHLELGEGISSEEQQVYDQLQSLLLYVQNDLPKESRNESITRNAKHYIVDRINAAPEKRTEAIMNASNYDLIQQKVISTLPILNSFLNNSNPSVDDFIECYDLINQLLWDHKDVLTSPDSTNIVLDAYLSIGRDLINKTTGHIQTTLDNQGINLGNPSNRARRRSLERTLEQTPPLLGSSASLEIKMDVDRDRLISLLYDKLIKCGCDESTLELVFPWVAENIQKYDLHGFENWLGSVSEGMLTPIGSCSGCEELYALYLSTQYE